MALRGDHRHVPAALADVRGPGRRQRPLPLHRLGVGAAHDHAHRRSAQGALRALPGQADRARGQGDRAHALRAALPAARADVPRSLPVAAPHLALPRRRPGVGIPPVAGSRAHRGHHLDGDARLLPAHGPQLGQHPRADSRRRRSLREALRPPPAGHVAGRVRLRARRRRAAARGGDTLLLRRHARRAVRRPASGVRRLRAHLLHQRRGGVRARHGVVAAGVELEGRLPRRQELPRLLPRHRVRPADGLHRPVRAPRGSPHLHRHQVPRDHPRPAARQVGLRSRRRARQGRPARDALPRKPRPPGARRCARTWIARR